MSKKPPEGLIRAAREYIRDQKAHLPEHWQAELLEPGTRVEHAFLGAGTILETDAEKGTYTIQFDDLETPRQLAARVKLTVVTE